MKIWVLPQAFVFRKLHLNLSRIPEMVHTLSMECVSSLNKPFPPLLWPLNSFPNKVKNPYFTVPGTETWLGMWPSPRDPTFLAEVLPAQRKCFLMYQAETWLSSSSFLIVLSSVAQSCPTLCDPMNRSTPGLPVHHRLPEFTQIRVHWVGDAIKPSHPLSSPSPPAPNPSQCQDLFQWVNSSHEVAKVLEFQLQHQSFQWTPGTNLL